MKSKQKNYPAAYDVKQIYSTEQTAIQNGHVWMTDSKSD